MDKLKPIIAQHFWILFVVVMLLPVLGWWSATSGFVAETADNKKAIEDAFKSVNYSDAEPNEKWTKEVTPYIERQKQRNADALKTCWEQQVPLMTWPETLRHRVPETFFGEFVPIARNNYRAEYPLEVERVWKVADPLDPETEEGTVILAKEQLPQRSFGDLPPSSQQMWEAQQDLWLLEALLKGIREVNEDATSITDSAIREIEVIQLLGGDGNPVLEGTGDTGGDPSESGIVTNRTASFGSGGADFDPASEFGPDADPNAGADDGSGDGGPVDTGTKEPEGLRYVGPQEGGTYLKRGFYLKVTIVHSKVPDLLVALTNLDFPSEVKRFQVAQASGRSGGSYRGDSDYASSGRNRPNRRTIETSDSGDSGRNRNLEQAAVAGNNLMEVAVCGLMVLYNPPPTPEGEEAAAEESTETPEGDQPPEPPATDGETTETTEPEGTDPASTDPATDGTESPDPMAGENPDENAKVDEGTAPETDPAAAEATSEEAPAPSAPDSDNTNGENTD